MHQAPRCFYYPGHKLSTVTKVHKIKPFSIPGNSVKSVYACLTIITMQFNLETAVAELARQLRWALASATQFVVLIRRRLAHISHHFVAWDTKFRFKNRQQQMTAENKLEEGLLVQANIRFCFATARVKDICRRFLWLLCCSDWEGTVHPGTSVAESQIASDCLYNYTS